jgi:hypothetical protein
VPLFEGTADGIAWRPYGYRFSCDGEAASPRFVAPYQPRIEYSLVYEALGMSHSNLMSPVSTVGNPYRFSHYARLERLAQRLLEGGSAAADVFRHNPFPASGPPPIAVRITLFMYTPLRLAEHAATGAWWRRVPLGLHRAAVRRDDTLWDRVLPEPELFHWYDLLWKRRAPALAAFAREAAGDTRRALGGLSGIEGADVERFWSDFVPLVRQGGANWAEVSAQVDAMRTRYGAAQLRRFERIVGALAFALTERLEPHLARLNLPTFLHEALLCHRIILAGEDAFRAAYADPLGQMMPLADERLVPEGLFLVALFRYETFAYHARVFRLSRRYWPSLLGVTDGAPGVPELIRFVEQHLRANEEDMAPGWTVDRRGEWSLEVPSEYTASARSA